MTWFSKTDESIVTNSLSWLSSFLIPSWHVTLFKVPYFFSEILKISDYGRNRNFEICYSFFSRNSLRCHQWFIKSTEKMFQFFRSYHHGWAAKKILFSRTSKMPVSSFCEYIYLKKINIERKTQAVNDKYLSEKYDPVSYLYKSLVCQLPLELTNWSYSKDMHV